MAKKTTKKTTKAAGVVLNWTRVLAAKHAAGKPQQKRQLQNILDVLKDPEDEKFKFLVFKTEEDGLASQIGEVIAGMPFKKDADEDEPPLFCPLHEHLEERERIEAERAEVVAKAEAEAKAKSDERAAEAARQAVERAERKKKQDAVLDAFGDGGSSENGDEDGKEWDDHFWPFVAGQGRVSDNRPHKMTRVVVDGSTDPPWDFPVINKEEFVDAVSAASSPEEYRVTCLICGETHALGEMHVFQKPVWRDGAKVLDGDGKVVKEDKAVSVAVAVFMAAMTEDGSDQYKYRRGDREGDPRKVPVGPCCNNCGRRLEALARGSETGVPREIIPNSASLLDLYKGTWKPMVDKRREEHPAEGKATIGDGQRYRQQQGNGGRKGSKNWREFTDPPTDTPSA